MVWGFLKPDVRKILLFTLFLFVMVGSYIQDHSQSPPPVHDLLRLLPFWTMQLSLILPLTWLTFGIPHLLFLVLYDSWFQVVYFYFLSCFVVFSYNKNRSRFPKKYWIITVIVSAILSFILGDAWSISFFWVRNYHGNLVTPFIGNTIILYFYIYILYSLGSFVNDRLVRKSRIFSDENLVNKIKSTIKIGIRKRTTILAIIAFIILISSIYAVIPKDTVLLETTITLKENGDERLFNLNLKKEDWIEFEFAVMGDPVHFLFTNSTGEAIYPHYQNGRMISERFRKLLIMPSTDCYILHVYLLYDKSTVHIRIVRKVPYPLTM